MGYILKKIKLHLLFNKKNYIMLAVQIFIGIFILSFVLTMYFSVNKSVDETKKLVNSPIINIFSTLNSPITDNPSFTTEDYEYIKKTYKDYLKFGIMARYDGFPLFYKNGAVDIWYVNNDILKIYINPDFNEDFEHSMNAYIKENAYKKLVDYVYNTDVGNNQFTLDDKVFDFIFMDSLNKNNLKIFNPFSNMVTMISDKIDLNYTILLPLNALNLKKDTHLFLHMQFADEIDYTVTNEIIEYLSIKHPDYTYTYARPAEMYEDMFEYVKEMSLSFLLLSYIILAIVTIGLFGLLLVYTGKRKREIAILLACGANRSDIYFEFGLSTFFIVAVSSLTASIFGGIFAVLLNNDFQYQTSFHFSIVFICLLISVAITLFAVFVPCLKIKDLKPIEILRTV